MQPQAEPHVLDDMELSSDSSIHEGPELTSKRPLPVSTAESEAKRAKLA